MATASVFDKAAEELERQTTLDLPQARGTLRIAVRDAGFDAKTISASVLASVITASLPRELAVRGIEEAGTVCGSICNRLESLTD